MADMHDMVGKYETFREKGIHATVSEVGAMQSGKVSVKLRCTEGERPEFTFFLPGIDARTLAAALTKCLAVLEAHTN